MHVEYHRLAGLHGDDLIGQIPYSHAIGVLMAFAQGGDYARVNESFFLFRKTKPARTVAKRMTALGSGFEVITRLSMPMVAGQSMKSSSVALVIVPDQCPIYCPVLSLNESGELLEI